MTPSGSPTMKVNTHEPTSVRSIFQYFDKNNDGWISAQDIRRTLQSLGENVTQSKVDEMLSELGILPVENVAYPKFEKLLPNYSKGAKLIRRSEMQGIFSRLDVDGSGYLTAAELSMYMNWMGLEMRDEEMAEMVSLFDADGDNEIRVKEFEILLENLGFLIVDDNRKETMQCYEEIQTRNTEASNESDITKGRTAEIELCRLDENWKDMLSAFDIDGSGKVSVKDVKAAGERFQRWATQGGVATEALHWDETIERRGLGKLIEKANHVALIVSDVGRSVKFYGDIMGFQQIRRPNFDKHGAWFTVGNVELHLIKGNPVCYQGQDLVVNHISVETTDIDQVALKLRRMGVPFRQNVSVPSGPDCGKKGTNESANNEKIMRQYFVKDPDGYYIEICDCNALKKYCLGKKEDLIGNVENVPEITMDTAAWNIEIMQKWSDMGKAECLKRRGALNKMKGVDASFKNIATDLGCVEAKEVDEELWTNFKERRSVWGDICQNETEESLREVLLVSGNNAHKASEIMHLKAANSGKKKVQPPAFYEQGKSLIRPPAITLPYVG